MEKAEENHCPIQQLPYEMLCEIFNYLDIGSVKQCSLTCRRWQEIIFSDSYIKRFKLCVKLPLPLPEQNALKISDRLYRNVNLQLQRSTTQTDKRELFNGIYAIFCYPKLEQLVTLKLSIPKEETNSILMLMNSIKKMNVLRELHIVGSYGWIFTSNQTISFKISNQSIRSLFAENIMPIIIKAPNLSSLRIVLNSYETVHVLNEKFLHSNQLPNLKHLELVAGRNLKGSKIASRSNVKHLLQFFSKLKTLETLKLQNVLTFGYLLKAICEHCTNLTVLVIESLHLLETSTLHHLSKLTKLRHLTFGNIRCLDPVSFRGVHLPNLESVALGSFPILDETLRAFKVATKITLLGHDSTINLIPAIATTMPNLKHVELEHFSATNLQSLNLLASVEELTIRFPIDVIVVAFRCIVDNIKAIHSLVSTIPSDSTIEQLLIIFPKLVLLKVGEHFNQTFI
ncbi:uncharacterized protein LOC126564835 [Anopheles maculipalpis]|uniref:uncharacterized protein LOC126564835 n=1 Tax=Anopheles maculipalpis TaxID=1496333 RepID=UPI0021590233|nr:uncharacterized protein LOC126564835 [Anopheles maculipalpis]